MFVCLLCAVFCAQAESFSFDFSEKVPAAWNASTAPYGFESDNRGAQWTSDAILTLAGVKGLTKVEITCSSNQDGGKNKMTVSLGSETLGTYAFNKEANIVKTFEAKGSDGDLQISLSRSAKSIYINKIVVTADSIVGVEAGDDQDDDDEDYELNYDWEPATKTTMDLKFDMAYYLNYDEIISGLQYIELYLDNEDSELIVGVCADFNSATVIAPGTYPINNTDELGTVTASPGGDEEEDYPTCLITDFNEEGQYSSCYYIVSGSMTVAKDAAGFKLTLEGKTYNGSTIKATFTGMAENLMAESAIEEVKAATATTNAKQMLQGRIVVNQNGKRYTTEGLQIK